MLEGHPSGKEGKKGFNWFTRAAERKLNSFLPSVPVHVPRAPGVRAAKKGWLRGRLPPSIDQVDDALRHMYDTVCRDEVLAGICA